jgi:deoxyadenosine/deoxycytidine kinase
MIIFINGPFGVGKTTIAEQLVQAVPNSLLFDPEYIGYMLRKIVEPIEKPYDFQDLPMWRTLVVATAQTLLENYGRTLIMPMTLWYRPYFDEIMQGLRAMEPQQLHHFCLMATPSTLEQRLAERPTSTQAWCQERNSKALVALQSSEFAQHIATDNQTITQVLGEILKIIS